MSQREADEEGRMEVFLDLFGEKCKSEKKSEIKGRM